MPSASIWTSTAKSATACAFRPGRARAKVKITFKRDGISRTIAAGTALTADGEQMYLLEEDVQQTGYEQEIEAGDHLPARQAAQVTAC